MGIQTVEYGGNGGRPFDMQAVHSVGVHWGGHIDALVLNGQLLGGPGADHLDPEVFLQQDEFISGFELRYGDVLTALNFFTNLGQSIGVAHVRGDNLTIVGDLRVLGLGGRAGDNLDRIAIKYIDNYTPSVLVEESAAIINIFGPGTAIERFTSTEVQTLVSHTTTMERVFSVDVGAESKPLFEVISKITAQFGYKSTTKEELKNEVTVTTQSSEKTTFTTPTGMVGLEMLPVEVFVDTQASPNFVWISPKGSPSIVTVDQNTQALTTNVYDLTTFLEVQMPSLLPRRQQRNGYNFYQMS
jgi:hypothetical protein